MLHLDAKKLARIRGVGHRIHGRCSTRHPGVGWETVVVCIDDQTRLAQAEVRSAAEPPENNVLGFHIYQRG